MSRRFIVAGTLLVTKSRADAAKEKEESRKDIKGPGVGAGGSDGLSTTFI